ncbi:MAG: hypothetical protein HC797_04800 [Anaerolineales bacterium]|nr:hypothetical protein [Anaerolineales bacterium]
MAITIACTTNVMAIINEMVGSEKKEGCALGGGGGCIRELLFKAILSYFDFEEYRVRYELGSKKFYF